MPSPFPGMNPYLEQTHDWETFHQHFCTACLEWLAPQVGNRYVVRMEQRLYIHEMPEDDRRLVGRGDVSVHRSPNGTTDPAPVAAVLTRPARARIPVLDVERQTFLEVRDRVRQEVVTVIEVLSPTNKRSGGDRDQYLAKREELFHSPANFVEIDLLRGGHRPPIEPLPACDYYALVSRPEERPDVDLWPVLLRERLPVVPVSLRPPDQPVPLDLQAVLHLVYDRGCYGTHIYRTTPEPPLAPDDAVWAAQIVPAR